MSGITRVSRYQKKHSPIHHPDHHPIFISFFHLPRSIASSLFKLRAWQSFCTTSFHVLFGLPLDLEPSTSYSIHFFTQLVSSFRNTCPYRHNLFCCSINIIWSFSQLLTRNAVFYLNITHPSVHSHLCSLKCHLIFFPLVYLLVWSRPPHIVAVNADILPGLMESLDSHRRCRGVECVLLAAVVCEFW